MASLLEYERDSFTSSHEKTAKYDTVVTSICLEDDTFSESHFPETHQHRLKVFKGGASNNSQRNLLEAQQMPVDLAAFHL